MAQSKHANQSIPWDKINPTDGWNAVAAAMQHDLSSAERDPPEMTRAYGKGIDTFKELLKECPDSQLFDENGIPQALMMDSYVEILNSKLHNIFKTLPWEHRMRLRSMRKSHWKPLPKMQSHWSQDGYAQNIPMQFQCMHSDHYINWVDIMKKHFDADVECVNKCKELVKWGLAGQLELTRILHHMFKDKTEYVRNPKNLFMCNANKALDDLNDPASVGWQDLVYVHPGHRHDTYRPVVYPESQDATVGYEWEYASANTAHEGKWVWHTDRNEEEVKNLWEIVGQPWPKNTKHKGVGRAAYKREMPPNMKTFKQKHFAKGNDQSSDSQNGWKDSRASEKGHNNWKKDPQTEGGWGGNDGGWGDSRSSGKGNGWGGKDGGWGGKGGGWGDSRGSGEGKRDAGDPATASHRRWVR